MKKLTMIAAALAAMTLSAVAADVYSSNIVGYKKVTIHPGYNMMGAGFGMIGMGDAQDFQKIFIDGDGVAVGGETSGLADTIQTWDPTAGGGIGGYERYYKYYEGSNPEWDNVWYKGNDDEIELPIDTSRGFWYHSLNTTSVVMTVAGEANAAETISVEISPGYNMVAFPFPTGFDINTDVDWAASGAVGGETSGLADTIQTWDPTAGGGIGGYERYYLYYEGSVPEWDYVWYKGNDDEITEPVSATKGFWYYHLGTGFTLTFKKPY